MDIIDLTTKNNEEGVLKESVYLTSAKALSQKAKKIKKIPPTILKNK